MLKVAKAVGKSALWAEGFKQKVMREAESDPFFKMLLKNLTPAKGEAN